MYWMPAQLLGIQEADCSTERDTRKLSDQNRAGQRHRGCVVCIQEGSQACVVEKMEFQRLLGVGAEAWAMQAEGTVDARSEGKIGQ